MPAGQPLRKPRPFPPNVLDIQAPQYPLPEPAPKPRRQRRTVPAQRPALPEPRRLSASERRLVEWMYRHLAFRFGAAALVRQYGAKAILVAVHDGMMIWNERRVSTYEGDRRVIRTVEERIINPRIISPPAFLRHVLKPLDRR